MRSKKNIMSRFLLGLVLVGAMLTPGCTAIKEYLFPKVVNDAEGILNSAIQDLSKESANWRNVLETVSDKLVTEAQSTIKNEVNTVLTRAIAASGSQVMCVSDFIRGRVREDLQRILAKLLNQEPSKIYPVFCQVVPQSVEASLVPSRIQLLEYYGYDFDKTPIKAFLESSSGRLEVIS